LVNINKYKHYIAIINTIITLKTYSNTTKRFTVLDILEL